MKGWGEEASRNQIVLILLIMKLCVKGEKWKTDYFGELEES
jgi:hypothetical protein